MAEDVSALPLSDLTIDTETRPPLPDMGEVSEAQRQAGRHLAAIHRHYLSDLSQIAQVMTRIEAGEAPRLSLRISSCIARWPRISPPPGRSAVSNAGR